MPSLVSVFSFLETILPEGFPTWHISRAQLLHQYYCAWDLHSKKADLSHMTLISLDQVIVHELERWDTEDKTFFLI